MAGPKPHSTSQRADLRQNLDATTLRHSRQPIEQLELGPGLTTEQALSFAEMYGLRNTGQAGGTLGVDISAEFAWEVTTGNRDVIVAVIIWSGAGEIPDNGIDDVTLKFDRRRP